MCTKLTLFIGSLFVIAGLTQIGYSFKTAETASGISSAAQELVASLSAGQKKVTLYPADSPQQVGWHFIPKDERKGLELNKMSEAQRGAVHKLLKTLLSEVGYTKATRIMELEKLLKELQEKQGRKRPIRDPLRYYVTLFGKPATSSRWGLSFEGHHLSLNFVIEGGNIVASTPQFFATNPATVKSTNSVGIPLGTRLLRLEETLAFELVNTLSNEQKKSALIAEKAPRDIRAAGSAQPPQDPAVGIGWNELSSEQQKLLQSLLNEYVKAVPNVVAKERRQALKEAGVNNIKFAWAGAEVPGIGHYYRIQGPTFLIELVNTQPGSDGNPANHIHAVWRDMRGDFGKPI